MDNLKLLLTKVNICISSQKGKERERKETYALAIGFFVLISPWQCACVFTLKIVRQLIFLFHPKFVWLRVSLEETDHHLISGNRSAILKQILLACFFFLKSTPLFPSQAALVVKNPPASARDMRGRFDPWVGKTPWWRAWQPTPVSLTAESHGQRSLAGYSP